MIGLAALFLTGPMSRLHGMLSVRAATKNNSQQRQKNSRFDQPNPQPNAQTHTDTHTHLYTCSLSHRNPSPSLFRTAFLLFFVELFQVFFPKILLTRGVIQSFFFVSVHMDQSTEVGSCASRSWVLMCLGVGILVTKFILSAMWWRYFDSWTDFDQTKIWLPAKSWEP
jgi:hypothetical protein